MRAHNSEGHLVLVLDDDSTVLDVCRGILKKAGYRVDLVTSTEEALARIEEGNVYAAVVSDIDMPQDGRVRVPVPASRIQRRISRAF